MASIKIWDRFSLSPENILLNLVTLVKVSLGSVLIRITEKGTFPWKKKTTKDDRHNDGGGTPGTDPEILKGGA